MAKDSDSRGRRISVSELIARADESSAFPKASPLDVERPAGSDGRGADTRDTPRRSRRRAVGASGMPAHPEPAQPEPAPPADQEPREVQDPREENANAVTGIIPVVTDDVRPVDGDDIVGYHLPPAEIRTSSAADELDFFSTVNTPNTRSAEPEDDVADAAPLTRAPLWGVDDVGAVSDAVDTVDPAAPDAVDDDDVPAGGLLDDGLLEDGLADDGLADDGLAEDRLPDDGLLDDGLAADDAATKTKTKAKTKTKPKTKANAKTKTRAKKQKTPKEPKRSTKLKSRVKPDAQKRAKPARIEPGTRAAIMGWLAFAGEVILGLAIGAGLFWGFTELWKRYIYLALILAVLVIFAIVTFAHILRKRDLATTLLALGVGMLVTIGPLVLLAA
ncbi:hypothetical protein [Gordonia shandongensis]|uniref:hypothetical protein n=1 Tax=Gordonia shandongensis TaxID=376351 RepID=UPI0004153352|nr:hypothetical protein [Gordonia shandongensis]